MKNPPGAMFQDGWSGWLLIGVMFLLAQIPASAQATYKNPIFDRDFPDPNLERGQDGYIYAYSTNTTWTDKGPGHDYLIPILRSKDLVHWNFVGTVFSAKPAWKKEGGLWAPDVTYFKGTYLLYYAFSTWGDADAGIGVATSDKPEGPFTDKGKLISSKEIKVNNSIDPFLAVEKDKLYLIWGSFNGIFGIPLSPDGTKLAGDKFQIAGNDFEGSYIYKKDGFYYFFGSNGSCCEGAASTYHVLMGRSKSLMGPYVDKEGKPLMSGGGTMFLHADGKGVFAGTGHNGDIVQDDAGTYWIVYHAFKKADADRGRVFMLDRVDWVDGWPKIANDEASTTDQPAPLFKK
jgi:arabinan endo-1,5-alpha-L-arabinosidase